jgi:hypothetical protein
VKLIKHAHEDLGHFGVQRTYNLLQIHYWWRGMQLQVQALVARCVVCNRVRASFNALMPQLQPLPIMGLGYRQGCLNGCPTVKFTVRTSSSSKRPRASVFIPWTRFYSRTVFMICVSKDPSTRTHSRVRTDPTHLRGHTFSFPPSPPLPSPPLLPTDASCCPRGRSRTLGKKKNYFFYFFYFLIFFIFYIF